MAVVKRIFSCSCGHKLRFGTHHCGSCWANTPFYNRREFWWILLVGLCLALAGVYAMI